MERMWKVGLVAALSALLWIGSSVAPAHATVEDRAEYEIKAAFLYNFARFTEWPSTAFASPNAPFVVGIFGGEVFDSASLEDINGKTVNGRRLQIRRLSDPQELDACHLIFISHSNDKAVANILNSARNKQILTVGETANFASAGGMVRLFSEDRRIRFEINLTQVQRADLKISAKLLALAKVVRETGSQTVTPVFQNGN